MSLTIIALLAHLFLIVVLIVNIIVTKQHNKVLKSWYDNTQKPTKLTEDNLKGINSLDELLDLKYGKIGTHSRHKYHLEVGKALQEVHKKYP